MVYMTARAGAALAAVAALGAASTYAYEDEPVFGGLDFLPTREGPPVIHRRGRFKPNQRKQRRGKK